LRYVKPALIDLGVLDEVEVIGPHDHHEANHEVDDACDGAAPAERPTSAD
jgi:hypothetical protein